MATDSASAAAAAAAAARAAAEARRRIEEAAREAARRAEEARKQAEQKPPPAPLKPPSLFNQKNVFQLAQKPKVDLNPPPTAPLSPNETRAYVSAAKAVTAKDPAANPHQVIAKSPELVSWIQSSSARLDQTLPTAQTDVNQQLAAELDSRLTVQNGAARLAAVAGADSGAITAPTAVTDAESAKAALTALSPKAKVKFSDGATGTDTVQGCAKALLASPNVKFWDDLSTGSDRKNLQRLADGEKSLVLADNAEHTGVAPNLKMMQALVAMSKAGPIQINALTGGNHSSGSNHYSGHAVDLDLNSGDAGQIEQIANRYGGTRNSESDHIHLDFLEGGSGPAATRVTATTGETNAGGSDKLIKPLDTPMPKSSEFDNPDGPEGMPGINGGTVHGALDWFAKGGTPVKAPVNGTVTEVTASKGNSGQVFGGVVKVKDDSGKLFVFRHIDPSGVSVGQKVKAGTELGKVTSWADSPSSSHCHMEIWKSESGGYNQANAIDPLKFYQKGVTGSSSDPGATPAGMLDAAALQKVMPKVDGKTAKEASPVVAQAIAAAGINDPKESAAFVAMVGQQTKQLSTPDAYQTVVDTATKWKADPSIGKAARKGDLNAVAKRLDLQVGKAQLDAGDKDQRVADRIDQIFAAANPEAASHKVKNEAGQLVTLGQLCVEEGQKHQMDPFLFMAIARQETQFGTAGVGVEKMLGVSAYDSDPDGDYGMNGLSAQIINGAETFDRLRKANGASPSDPIEKQIAAVNGYTNGDPSGPRGQVWASDPNWYQGVTANYQELTKNGDGLGPPQYGEKFYSKALDVFGANAPKDAAAPSPSGSSSGAVSSGGAAAPSGGTTAGAPAATPPANDGSAVVQTPELAAMQRQTKALGYDIDEQLLWGILQMLSDSYGDIISSLSSDPDFAAFVKSQPGMKNWRPGKPVPKAMVAAFLSKKMKGKGIKAQKNGVLTGPDGKPLNGWQDVSKALGLKAAKGGTSPDDRVAQLPAVEDLSADPSRVGPPAPAQTDAEPMEPADPAAELAPAAMAVVPAQSVIPPAIRG